MEHRRDLSRRPFGRLEVALALAAANLLTLIALTPLQELEPGSDKGDKR